MLAATLKGTMLMGLTALALEQAAPTIEDSARAAPPPPQPGIQLLIETETTRPDEILLIWL